MKKAVNKKSSKISNLNFGNTLCQNWYIYSLKPHDQQKSFNKRS